MELALGLRWVEKLSGFWTSVAVGLWSPFEAFRVTPVSPATVPIFSGRGGIGTPRCEAGASRDRKERILPRMNSISSRTKSRYSTIFVHITE